MEIKKICKNLGSAISEIYESMFFMFPEEVGEEETGPSLPKSCFCARVSLKGSGVAFILFCSERVVEDMAKNLLGEEKKFDEESLIDVLKEAVNVIAGSLLTKSGIEGDVSLGVPHGKRLEGETEEIIVKSACEAVFNVEGEWLKGAMINE